MHTHHRTTAAAILAAILTACGGGGGGGEDPGMNGSVVFEGGNIGPDPATASQALTLDIAATFTGQVDAGGSFEIPFTVRRVPAATYRGTMRFTLTSGQQGNGVYSGAATMTIPAGQPVGTNTYCVTLLPAESFDFNGSVSAESCAPNVITAS